MLCRCSAIHQKPVSAKACQDVKETQRVCYSLLFPIGSMYGIYGNIYHQYTPNVSIYTIHGSYGFLFGRLQHMSSMYTFERTSVRDRVYWRSPRSSVHGLPFSKCLLVDVPVAWNPRNKCHRCHTHGCGKK